MIRLIFVTASFMVWLLCSVALIKPETAIGQDSKTAEELSAMIEANPDSLELHQRYLEVAGLDRLEIAEQYEDWAEKFPQSAIVPFAIGSAYASAYNFKAKSWLLRAVERDENFAEAWRRLSLDAEF